MLLCLVSAITLAAQTQRGIVKTPGRLSSNGKVIAGQRISGATVQVKGRSAVLSGSDGTFSFPIPASKFFIQGVKKKGYVLNDPEATARQYTYSSNPLILVLETPSQQTDSRLANERKIRRSLQRQLLNKEEEIEALKEQNKITEQEYQRKLKQLYDEQRDNEKLISEMADRYSQIDFDQMDEFDLRISECILNGRLTEADSLLRSKGDIHYRITQLQQHHEANEQAQAALDKSKAMERKTLEDIARDCYHYFERFYLAHQNDSALHYLELRAALDTTNVDWQVEAGVYIKDFIADYQRAERFLSRALRQARLQYGEENEKVAGVYYNLGVIYDRQGDAATALEYYNKVIALGHSDQSIAATYNNIGLIYHNLSDYTNALQYFTKALEIDKKTVGERHPSTGSVYNNMGMVHQTLGDYSRAMECYTTALDIFEQAFGKESTKVSAAYSNIGQVYNQLGQTARALEYDLKAIDIDKRLLGDHHPMMVSNYINVGACYSKLGEYPKALEYYSMALSVCENNSVRPTSIATLQSNIGMVYDHMGEYQKALEHLLLSISIYEQAVGKDHVSTAVTYNNAGWVYCELGRYTEALDYLTRAINVLEKKLGSDHPNTRATRSNLNKAKQQMGN